MLQTGIKVWMTSINDMHCLILGAWDSELTVSERVKEKEGWIQAWMISFWSMGL
jgi:hypothetical protein